MSKSCFYLSADSFLSLPTPSKLSFGVALAIAVPCTALAQSDRNDLDQIVVTATRTAVTSDDTLAPIEVITRDEIARSQAGSVETLLRGRAGINLSNQGGAGKLSTLFLRGAESDHVLVLVDGVRFGSATSGLAALQDLPLAQIDRIEIVRGSRSSLYGADAIGGVIQIFTRRDTGAMQLRFRAGIGSHAHREASIGIGGSSKNGWYGADLTHTRTDGINACRGSSTAFAGCFTEEPDRDGYDNRSLSLRGGLNLGELLEIEGRALHARGRNEYDGSFANRSQTLQQTLGVNLRWHANERTTLRVDLGRHKDQSDDFLDTTATGHFDSSRDSASLQADIAITDTHLLTLGADQLRDRIGSDTAYDRKHRGNRAVFAQYQGAWGRHDLQLALRRDDNDQFGGKTTGTAAWGVDFGDGWRATASYGTAFKAPSFNELYYPFFGNPALRPESSRSVEAGLAWRGEQHRLRLDAFVTEIDDLIAFDIALFLPNNLERARMRGAELRYDTQTLGWQVGASASWLDTDNRAVGPNRGNDLPRRARETARLELDRAFGKLQLGFTGIAEGARFDDLANTRRLGGFATLDARIEYAFAKHWALQARATNVFDKRYETAAFYNQAGREWFFGLRFVDLPPLSRTI